MSTITKNQTLKALRVTGILLLLSLIMPILNWGIILSGFLSPEGNIALKILENEIMFRVNIIIQVISSVLILTLGYFLHLTLKPVNADISLYALLLKIFESLLILILALVHLIVLYIIKEGFYEKNIINGLISNYIYLTSIPGIFFGFGMLLFSFLFFKSGIIPKWLAIFGIIAFMLVITYDTSTIITLNFSSLSIIQIIGSGPVCLFQVTLGIYLLFKKQLFQFYIL